MNIGVDIDGVLADFNTSYISLIFKHSGIQLPPPGPDFPKEWHYHKAFGVCNKDLNAVWEEIKTTNFWQNLGAEPFLLETIGCLLTQRARGDDIYFITSRPGFKAKLYTERWLTGYGMLSPTVLIAEDAEAKAALAWALKLDIFIDDRPENCAAVDAANIRNCQVFLVDRPYNRASTPFIRVPSALAALEEVFLATKRAA